MFNSGAILILCVGAYGQNPAAPFSGPAPEPERTVPVYKVTVVERSFQAVNYQYRSGPTEIDFKGTVLLPNSKGHATVESKRGGTDIDAKFDKLTPPTPFGRQYLTYVLWAISPEGAPHNLGEVVANGGDSARLHVTTDLQVFGLLVTAEPYSAVRQPSDVVVMENQVRWDTIGRTQPIVAKAELLSRGQFTYDKQAGMAAAAVNTPRISMDEYEKLLEIYQAENAIGIARAAHADELAPETFFKAQAAYDEARRLLDGRVGVSLVVQSARAAAQTADDARMIALRRAQEARVANAELQAEQAKSEAQQARVDADAARAQVDSARAQADAARAQAESERIARQQAESQAAQAPSSQDLPIAPPPPAPVAPPPARSPIAYQPQPDRQQQQARMRMLERLNSVAVTRDTPRGLVTTLTDMNFDGGTLRPSASDVLARLAPVLMQPGVRVSVEGYSDSAAGAAMSERRVDAVRDMLARRGVASVTTRNFADARPLTSNATAEGRMENRRVEIVISGDAVGSQPLWDRSYDVTLRQ
jgi:outer membrane protein OmpA-like peptidoglycan-associated protein